MLVMFSFCPLPGVLEFRVSKCPLDVFCPWSALVLVMFSLFCPLPCLRGVLECSSLSLVIVMFSLFCPLPWSARVCP